MKDKRDRGPFHFMFDYYKDQGIRSLEMKDVNRGKFLCREIEIFYHESWQIIHASYFSLFGRFY